MLKMKSFWLGVAVVLGLAGCSSAPTAPASATSAPAASGYLLTNVNVVPVLERPTGELPIARNMQVLVQGDRIVTVAGKITPPPGVQTINGKGAYLLPGFAEMHGHVPPATSFEGIPSRYLDDVLKLYVAAGVTTVRGMLGHPHQLQLKTDIAEGKRIGPTLFLAGPSFSGGSVQSVAQALQRVRDQHAGGWDLIKIHPGLSLEEYLAIADLANSLEFDFGGHVPSDVGLGQALQAGQRSIDHLDGYLEYLNAVNTPITETQLDQAVKLSLEHQVGVVPTQALWRTLIGAADADAMRAYPELALVPTAVRERWLGFLANPDTPYRNSQAAAQQSRNRDRLLRALYEGGVPVWFGTDAPQLFSVPGFSIAHEISAMQEAGFSNSDIIYTATRAVGDYFAETDEFGSIAPGQRADFIVMQGNPLEDLSGITQANGVMLRGTWYSRAELDALLADIRAAYSAAD